MSGTSNQGILHDVCSHLYTDTHPQLSNSRQRFETLGRKLGDYKRILMLLGSNDVAGLRRLLAAALRRGASAQTICGLLE
jgi:hypothetical protein